MKYSYLPEAHNDYILAIIGEEVGFLGTLLLFLVFAMLIYSAFRIAEQATDRRGALMASGSAVILAVQFLINALGILNVFPMTGKPLPFISYGGSSIIVSLMLAGLILRVSHESARRDEYDRRRDSFAVMDESTAGGAPCAWGALIAWRFYRLERFCFGVGCPSPAALCAAGSPATTGTAQYGWRI